MTRNKIVLAVLMLSCLGSFSSCREIDVEALKKALESRKIEGATYVGSETCAMCHEKQMKEFKTSSHASIAIPMEGVKVEGCEMCHGPGSLHAEAGGGAGVQIIDPDKDPSMCYSCHMEKKAQFNLPYHHPVPEGHMSCTDCHDPHGEAKTWSATSFDGVNEKCFNCHKEQRGPFAYEHLALREGCTSCHQVHGSINDKMLIAKDSNLCIRCHASTGPARNTARCLNCHASTAGLIGHTTQTNRLSQGACYSGECHGAVHGSNFSKHLRY